MWATTPIPSAAISSHRPAHPDVRISRIDRVRSAGSPGRLVRDPGFDEYRGRKVISISGDGGFGQYAMEFTTAVKYGMNITHISF
jgi:hypothetical protein